MWSKKVLCGMGLLTLSSVAAMAAGMASANDKAFEAKVSQGGMYEVEASKVAEQKAQAQYVKDQANTEVHDHMLVGAKLKSIAEAAGLAFPTELNAEFAARLAKLKGVPATHFDAAYVSDMKSIHAKDEKLFAQEAVDGSGAFQEFAAETDKVVKQHIGALNAN